MEAERRRVEELVRRAFASVPRPPNGALHESDEGPEGPLLEADFQDKQDWRTLEAAFLDEAPGGFASALSFFSREALRYFLPAYLLADLAERLDRVDVAYSLSGPFTDQARSTPVNPRRYGGLTRFDSGKERFAPFERDQVAAIVAFLEYKARTSEFDTAPIREALANYWRPRLAGGR